MSVIICTVHMFFSGGDDADVGWRGGREDGVRRLFQYMFFFLYLLLQYNAVSFVASAIATRVIYSA